MDELAAYAVDNKVVFAHFGSEFTPIDVREKIATVAKKTMASARAPEFAAQTGAAVYWQNPEEAAAQFEADIIVMGTMAEIFGQ
jgi:tripartite-type tricarboxylate transporter receptor subunit TctC